MRSSKWTIVLAFAAVYIIWGSTYLAIQLGIRDIPPFLLSSIRFLLAGIALFAWCLWKKDSMPSRKDIGRNAICGALMLFGGTVSVTWAEQYIPSSVAAIIVTSLPFWFVLLDKKQWSYYFSNKLIIAGLLVGFLGVVLLMSSGHTAAEDDHTSSGKKLAGSLVIVAGGIAWTIGSLYSKYKPSQSSLIMNGSIQLLATGIFTSVISIAAGEPQKMDWSQVQFSSWLALLYLATMGSIVAYLSYLYLLKMRPAAEVSTYVYVNPVVALLLGALIASEPIGWWQVVALLIILCGVFLVNMPKYAQAFTKKTA
jgi:drug/metabolite transporter (DMT)-like permease